jgi:hypothetical protein
MNIESEEHHKSFLDTLRTWLQSCTRNGKISRNTIAIGIVVLNHLRRASPVQREQVISQGGEVAGARSGLGTTLELYGIPKRYLKEVTTRQGHQDGQRLFELFGWGSKFSQISDADRDLIILELIGVLQEQAIAWLNRPNLKIDIDRHHSPVSWINIIIENAKGISGGIVEQQLVGAKLKKRFGGIEIPNHPAHAADRQTDRDGDFAVAHIVYHVTSAPSLGVLQKCAANIRLGLRPVLLVPREHLTKAQVLTQMEGIEKTLVIHAIEEFVTQNIMEMAVVEKKDCFTILKEIVDIYNQRLSEVETDLSLRIEIR